MVGGNKVGGSRAFRMVSVFFVGARVFCGLLRVLGPHRSDMTTIGEVLSMGAIGRSFPFVTSFIRGNVYRYRLMWVNGRTVRFCSTFLCVHVLGACQFFLFPSSQWRILPVHSKWRLAIPHRSTLLTTDYQLVTFVFLQLPSSQM